VVLPQLRPVLIFVTITSTIGSLQLFDENYILTGGGPANATLTPVLLMYKTGFRDFDFGYASAIAWMLVVLIGLLSLLQFRVLRERK
jgi:lactose/L-arabinose transport system permease protein